MANFKRGLKITNSLEFFRSLQNFLKITFGFWNFFHLCTLFPPHC
ncbi:hypothetical protein XCR_4412 [Xanthomonas campestris pv. raphani 756C]|nr:hypothetical protein XCR_4412 [Xanthomonas campestris pv. raphani 756C]